MKSKQKTSKRKKKKASPQKGKPLFNQVVELTGIPARAIKGELKTILERKNIDAENMTLDQLREIAATYVREIMGSLIDRSKRDEQTH